MDSSGRHTRNSSFNIVVSPFHQESNRFRVNLQSPIRLNPEREWEAAIIDSYLPVGTDKVKEDDSNPKWFQYAVCIGIPQSLNTYQRHYYNPASHESVVHSFIDKFDRVQKSVDNYGQFTNQRHDPKLKIEVIEDHLQITVVKEFVRGECIAVRMPSDHYRAFFTPGISDDFDAYMNGEQLQLIPNKKPWCYYEANSSELRIHFTDENPYARNDASDMNGLVFKSRRNVSLKHVSTKRDDFAVGKFLDVVCSLIETTRLGRREGGTRVMDVVNVDNHENINLKYFKLETVEIDSISMEIIDSVTKEDVYIERIPFIVINIRPQFQI